jgi:hypothetical protein
MVINEKLVKVHNKQAEMHALHHIRSSGRTRLRSLPISLFVWFSKKHVSSSGELQNVALVVNALLLCLLLFNE